MINELRGVLLVLRKAPLMPLVHPDGGELVSHHRYPSLAQSVATIGSFLGSGNVYVSLTNERTMLATFRLAPNLEFLADDDYINRLTAVPNQITFLRPLNLPLKTIWPCPENDDNGGMLATISSFGFGVYSKTSEIRNGYPMFRKENDSTNVVMYHQANRWIVARGITGTGTRDDSYFCEDSSLDPTRMYAQNWAACMNVAVEKSMLDQASLVKTTHFPFMSAFARGPVLLQRVPENVAYNYIYDARWIDYLVAVENPHHRQQLHEIRLQGEQEVFDIEIPGMVCVNSSSFFRTVTDRELGGTSRIRFR